MRLKNRNGLKQLLKDVVDGKVNYQAILVYDASRWGRFQDTDESAHYEYLQPPTLVLIPAGTTNALLKQRSVAL